MNCQQGDLALVIGPANPISIGKVVTCVEFWPSGTIVDTPGGIYMTEEPAWLTDRVLDPAVSHGWGRLCRVIRDSALMPLRPPASDETDTAERDVTEGLDALRPMV